MSDNPLRIFSQDQLDRLSSESLKSIKKEIMLEFQFTDEPQIKLNAHLVDRNEVLDIFARLEGGLDQFMAVEKDGFVKAFFDNGSLAFLKNNRSFSYMLSILASQPDLQEMASKKLGDHILLECRNYSSLSHEKIKMIKSMAETFEGVNERRVWSKTLSYMREHVDKLKETFETPFFSHTGSRYNADIGQYVNLNFYELFNALPDIFEPMASDYCMWCNNAVVFKSVERQKTLARYSYYDLVTLRDAAQIAATRFSADYNIDLVNLTNSELRTRKPPKPIKKYKKPEESFAQPRRKDTNRKERKEDKKEEVSDWRKTLPYIIGIAMFVILPFVIFTDSCNNKSTPRSNNSEVVEDRPVFEYAVEEEIPEKPASVMQGLNADLAGNDYSLVNPKLVKTKNLEKYTELSFLVDVLPSRNEHLYKFVPDDLIKKYKGEVRSLVMKFEVRNVKGSKVEHGLKVDFGTDPKHLGNSYDFFKSEMINRKDKIVVKGIPKDDFRLSGILSQVGAQDGKIKSKQRFVIEYDSDEWHYVAKMLPSGKKYIIERSYTKLDVDTVRVLDDKSRLIVALHNLNRMNGKVLERGRKQNAQGLWSYDVNPSEKERKSSIISINRTMLKYTITSGKDKTSYLDAAGKNNHMKFYVDHESRVLKGMVMTTIDEKMQTVDRVQMFRDE